jgi:NitT/TauT family transport system ATP-binding protein
VSVLSLDRVQLTYPDGTAALAGVSVELAAGELVAVVGPSGGGKSSLLRIAAGLTAPTGGTVARGIDRIGFVFQDPTLLPWRTVRRNVELAGELTGMAGPERRDRAAAAIERVGLTDFARHRPRTLSGGMRMRASLARALTLRPDLLLLDEPFGALDELTRARLGDELQGLFVADGIAALLVTHSIAEAVHLADRVLVLSDRPGRVLAEVAVAFDRPRPPGLRFTAEFAKVAGEISAALLGGAAAAAR